MLITHAYRNAKSEALHNSIVSHSIKYETFDKWNYVECKLNMSGITKTIQADTHSDINTLAYLVPIDAYKWMRNHLFPESIALGEHLAKSLRKQAKIIQEYTEAPHVVYGVARDDNGRLRTFFKPCDDDELENHEKHTEHYVYAVH